MSEDRFYVRGTTSYETFKAFRAALEKMVGRRLDDAWYDDERNRDFFDAIDRRHDGAPPSERENDA